MSQFPSRLHLPKKVKETRVKRQKEINFSITFGICARIAIVLFEFTGVYLFHSSVLFLDAISSLFDVVFSIVLLIFINLAERPPDRNHPFGHGRLEPLIGLQLALLLAVAGFGLILQQFFSLKTDVDHLMHPLAWTFPCAAMLILEGSYFIARRIAKEQNSSALLAEARHYRIDSITSALALVSLLFSAHLPSWNLFIDHLGAMFIACFMLILGIKSAKENFSQLMDTVPEESFFVRVRKAALKVSGVLETEKVGILQYGPDAHVNIDIEVDPNMSVVKAHKLTQQVRLEIQKEWPAVRDVTVHVEPYYPGDH